MREEVRNLSLEQNALQGAPWLCAMARVFERGNAPLYIVGGAVRNPLMGLPLSDVDVCGPLRPEAVVQLCEGTEIGARLRAAHFGTVELYAQDERGARHMAEYTTFREDSYRCGHRPESVRFTTDIAVDALRRDFSVNALYRRVFSDGLGEVVDPTGGMTHLRQGVLHTVTANPDQVLSDDGLRILRAARFQAELDLRPTEALRASLARHAHLLGEIACERLRDELQKVLLADLRYPMLKRRAPATLSGLDTIDAIGAWPQLMDGAAYDARAAEALFRLSVPEGLSPLAGRMALLLRRAGSAAVRGVMGRLRFSARETEQAAMLVDALAKLEAGSMGAFEGARAGICTLSFASAAFEALYSTDAKMRTKALLEGLLVAPLSLRELAVNGSDLLPLVLGRGVPRSSMGGLLTELWRRTVENGVPNERAALMAEAEKMICLPPTRPGGDIA